MSEPVEADFTRHTLLGAERPWLDWWRSGITAATASVAVGGVVRELGDSGRTAYVSLGCGYTLARTLAVIVVLVPEGAGLGG